MSIGLTTMGMFLPPGTGSTVVDNTGGGGTTYIERQKRKPTVMVSRISHKDKDERDIKIQVLSIEEV